MNNILEKLQQLTLNRLVTRLKHLRGRHDQLDHAWNRGMGRGGGGAALAPNQMGPLPTTDFYRQRRIELMEQQRQGQITNAEMRRQMRDLRGITVGTLESNQSNDLILGNNTTESIKDFIKKRNKSRLRRGIKVDVSKIPFSQQGGVSGVKKLNTKSLNSEGFVDSVYYYRDTPQYRGTRSFPSDSSVLWSLLRGPLKGLAADNIASAMGLPIAPVAQESSDGFVITSKLPLARRDWNEFLNKLYQEHYANPTPENYLKIKKLVEPLAIMDLIIGQNDGHDGNINLIKKFLPISIFITSYSFEYFYYLVKKFKAEGTEILYSMISLLENTQFDKFTFQKIKNYSKKYGLTFLSNIYFDNIKSKQLLLK